MAILKFIFSFSLILATLQITEAVNFTVTNNASNTPGGDRFTKEIGTQYSLKILESSTSFIWKTFRENSPNDRKDVTKVSLFIESMDGVAYTAGDEIHVSAEYIQAYSGNIKIEFTGVMYHEITHIWQWSGNDSTPGGLIEGVADFVRLKAGYAPSHWVKPGQGDRWDQGYDVTARFLEYCNSLKSGFVAEINKKMRNGYSDDFFVDILGMTVGKLWSDYKAKYQN